MKHQLLQRFCRLFLPIIVLSALLLGMAGCTPEELPRDAGSMVAYLSKEGLMLYRFDDQTSTLLHKGRYLSAPQFSETGSYIYFRMGSDMFCAPTDGSRAVLAAKNAEFLCTKGEAGLFLSPTEGVTRFDPVSGESTVLIAPPEDGYISAVSFSPDGSRAVYTVCKDDVGRTVPLALCVTVPGSAAPDDYPIDELPDRSIPTAVAWTPDGSACVLLLTDPQTESCGLMLFSVLDGTFSDFSGRVPQITDSAELKLSADGKTLAATAYRSTTDLFESILLVDLVKCTYSYRPGGYAPMLGCAVSADGDAVAYSLGESSDTAYGIFVHANDKTLLICGGEGTSYVYPSFFADGQELFFLNTFDGKISLCRAYANSSGASVILEGIAAPDGVYCKTLRDTFCIYDTTGRTDDVTVK